MEFLATIESNDSVLICPAGSRPSDCGKCSLAAAIISVNSAKLSCGMRVWYAEITALHVPIYFHALAYGNANVFLPGPYECCGFDTDAYYAFQPNVEGKQKIGQNCKRTDAQRIILSQGVSTCGLIFVKYFCNNKTNFQSTAIASKKSDA